jgi:hypothetical protein
LRGSLAAAGFDVVDESVGIPFHTIVARRC